MTTRTLRHPIVIPGQVIATSSEADPDGGFLRGHGTYLETHPADHPLAMEMDIDNSNAEHDESNNEHGDPPISTTTAPQSLISSTVGTIERTNKLITVHPPNAPYAPQPGDPIIGRVQSLTSQKWNVALSLTHTSGKTANLPLTGMVLPDGMQRMRTAADARSMRTILKEGDVICAEVRNVQSVQGGRGGLGGISASGGVIILHARSVKCGKLENGCWVHVPSWLVGRRKKQFIVLGSGRDSVQDGFDGVSIELLLGCNGGIWIQKAMTELDDLGDTPMQEDVMRIRKAHAESDLLVEERKVVARVRNAIEALKAVYCRITPDNVAMVVKESAVGPHRVEVHQMLEPSVILQITACTRQANQR
jgi:exosome complex component RRP4